MTTPNSKPVNKPLAKAPAAVAAHGAVTKPSAHVTARSEAAVDVAAKKGKAKAKKPVAAKHHPVVVKAPAKAAQSHPTQVVHP
jgi:hypothetical protein